MNLQFYNGEHSVIFGSKHSWNDWKLIPSSVPVIPPPKPRTEYLNIPGTNGSIDISEMLVGYPLYDNRTGSFQFIYLPDYGPTIKLYDRIMNEVHGRRIKLILTDEPDYYYEGRVTVKEPSYSREYSGFQFEYTLDPFKLQTHVSPGYQNISVSGTKTLVISIGTSPMRQTPYITSSAAMTGSIQKAGDAAATTFNVLQGTWRYPACTLGPGANTLTFTGTGTISIDVRGGGL